MNQEEAREQIKKRFWNFKNRLVDVNPEYHLIFDNVIANSNSNGCLWEVLELADMHLDADIKLKGGEAYLNSTDYLNALLYGYRISVI
jgi:hypothetical protein